MSHDKDWAVQYLIDPLHEPEPSQLDGPGTHFRPPPSSSRNGAANVDEQYTGSTAYSKASPSVTITEDSTGSSTNPFRKGSRHGRDAKPRPREVGNGSTRGVDQFPTGGLNPFNEGPSRRPRSSDGRPQSSMKTAVGSGKAPRRASSLRDRYPGDPSTRPLDTLKRENKLAHRSPHLHKRHIPGTDSIDRLDDSAPGFYHHESAYDAAALARNSSFENSPLAALEDSTREAIRATPRENVRDAIDRHRPLEGTAHYPPGEPDRLGRVLHYQEGSNMMTEFGGDYKRWPGIAYHPDDIKGKGEPSYSIERSLKEHRADGGAIELTERPRRSHDSGNSGRRSIDADNEGEHHSRVTSAGHRLSGEMRRRIGNMRRKDGQPAESSAAT